jgi:hypothetical protein
METTLEDLLADFLAEVQNGYFVLGKQHQGDEPGGIKELLEEYDEQLKLVTGFGLTDLMLVSSNNGGISFIGNSPSIVSVSSGDRLSVAVIAGRLNTEVGAIRISDSSRAAIDEDVSVTPDSIVRAIAKCIRALYPQCIVSDMLVNATHPHKELSSWRPQ